MEITVYSDNFDKNGKFLIDAYINYFIDNIQNKIELDGETYLEGDIGGQKFLAELYSTFQQSEELIRWSNDKKLDKLHQELKKAGLKLCPMNFYTLCSYILSVVKEQYLALLKPTIEDTLSELSDIKSITFNLKNGETIQSSNSELIKLTLENLHKHSEDTVYEVEKIVKIDEATNRILLQSAFVYLVASFLSEYFKDFPRRSNCCIVSAKEQDLILYMLYFLGLSPVPLTDSRFRQLVSHYKTHRHRVTLANIPDIGLIPIQLIKYKDWKDGNIQIDEAEIVNDNKTVKIQFGI